MKLPFAAERQVVSQTDTLNNYEHTRSVLADIVGPLEPSSDRVSDEVTPAWNVLWAAAATRLRRQLETGDLVGFEAAFPIVSEAVWASDALGREAAMPLLFGDFTRCAIAAGIDRTRFVDWFGPVEILKALPDRMRGRVLYFDRSKGRGKILASDRTVCFVSFVMIREAGFRFLIGGELVEFTPTFGQFNKLTGVLAHDVVRLREVDGNAD